MNNVTNQELQEMYEEAKNIVISAVCEPRQLTLPTIRSITFNKRKGLTRMGDCRRHNVGSVNEFSIRITESYVNHPKTTKHEVMDTIIHELIHCLPHCYNHGQYFKYYGSLVNNKFGYNIKRTGVNHAASEVAKTEEALEYKYTVKCGGCNKIVVKRKKYSKVIKLIESGYKGYSCKLCGSHDLKVIKNKNME